MNKEYWCLRVHAHIEAESKFGACLKLSSAILAVIMNKDHGCEDLELETDQIKGPHDESPSVTLPPTGGLNS